jgi:cytochrome P450
MTGLLDNYLREPSPPASALAHIPGSDGWPLIGQSLEFLRDPLRFTRRIHATYGPVSRTQFLFERRVNLLSAEGNEWVLLDREHQFSAHRGWQPVLGQLFPRGLMLRDGDDHRYHRRLMQPAFRKEALAYYLERMNPRIVRTIENWRQRGRFPFYGAVKQLTLDIAADVFLGVELQAEIEQVGRDFTDVVEASKALNRIPAVGVLYARGLKGRARLEQFLLARIAQRRAGHGADLFSQLCHAQDENGQRYSDAEVVDHLIFLMMAAHDTTTSALSTIVHALTRHPEWQDRLRDRLPANASEGLAHENLAQLESIEWVLREALRLYPPLTIILRRAVRDCEFHGYRIPANTTVNLYPIFTQRMSQWWTDPDRFDPERFAPSRAEHKRHPFAWTPFGGGAHMCLGLHFAEMQVKAVLHLLLQGSRLWAPATADTNPFQLTPIVRPRNGLPVELRPL